MTSEVNSGTIRFWERLHLRRTRVLADLVGTVTLSLLVLVSGSYAWPQNASRELPPQPRTFPGFGQPLPDSEIEIDGETRSLREELSGKWSVVLFHKVMDESALDYPSVLSKVYGSGRLKILYVTADTAANRAFAMSHRDGDRGVVIGVDKGNVLEGKQWFGGLASLVLDPSCVVQYSSWPFPAQRNVLRALLERNLGAPPASKRAVTSDEGPSVLPDVELTRISDSSSTHLKELLGSHRVVVFYPAGCTSCSRQSYVSQLSVVKIPTNTCLVFSKMFHLADVKGELVRAGVSPAAAYLANDYIAGWENPYWAGIGPNTVPKVLVFSTDGRLQETRTYSDWQKRNAR